MYAWETKQLKILGGCFRLAQVCEKKVNTHRSDDVSLRHFVRVLQETQSRAWKGGRSGPKDIKISLRKCRQASSLKTDKAELVLPVLLQEVLSNPAALLYACNLGSSSNPKRHDQRQQTSEDSAVEEELYLSDDDDDENREDGDGEDSSDGDVSTRKQQGSCKVVSDDPAVQHLNDRRRANKRLIKAMKDNVRMSWTSLAGLSAPIIIQSAVSDRMSEAFVAHARKVFESVHPWSIHELQAGTHSNSGSLDSNNVRLSSEDIAAAAREGDKDKDTQAELSQGSSSSWINHQCYRESFVKRKDLLRAMLKLEASSSGSGGSQSLSHKNQALDHRVRMMVAGPLLDEDADIVDSLSVRKTSIFQTTLMAAADQYLKEPQSGGTESDEGVNADAQRQDPSLSITPDNVESDRGATVERSCPWDWISWVSKLSICITVCL
jgi:hypothetical protein